MDKVSLKEKFLNLYLPIKDKVEKYCLALTGNADEAKDLVSESILTAYSSMHKLRNEDAFKFYLFKIAKRLCFKRNVRKKRFVSIDQAPHENVKSSDINALQKLHIEFLHQSIARLPVKLKEALVLHEISGFSMKEVASIQKCSLSAAKVRVMRAREKLKDMLQDEPIITTFRHDGGLRKLVV